MQNQSTEIEEAKGLAVNENDAIVAHNMDDLRQMYEKHHTMKGYKPKEILDEERGTDAPVVVKPRMIVIPDSIFSDFKVLTEQNEKAFQFMAFFAACQILEKVEDDCWALEFPACISSEGRPFLYEVAAYFRLAHHSQG